MSKRILVTVLLFTSISSYAQNWDINTLKNINENRNNSIEGSMTFLNNSEYYVSGAVPLAQAITGYIRKDRAMMMGGVQTIIGYGYTTLITYCYKYSLQRDRPYITYQGLNVYQSATDPSFPSGHSAIAFSTATTISLCYPRWYVIAPAYLWASATGYSQMYLGMHYPSDVIVGAIVGAGSSWLSLKTTKWLQERKQSKTLVSY